MRNHLEFRPLSSQSSKAEGNRFILISGSSPAKVCLRDVPDGDMGDAPALWQMLDEESPMGAAAKAVINPIALQCEGEANWFLGSLAIIKASGETTGGRVAIIEILAPEGCWFAVARPHSGG